MKATSIIVFLIFLTSCDPLSNDFLYRLFNVEIDPKRICENNPSILSEGRFIEVYLFSESDFEKVVSRIKDQRLPTPNETIMKYGNYEQIIPWQSTPVSKNNLKKMNIDTDIKDQDFACFTSNDINELLRQEGNLYSFLEDHLKDYKLFILECKTRKLYLVTSYEM